MTDPTPDASYPPVANAVLYAGLNGAAKAKPGVHGLCNNERCLMFSAAVVERGMVDATGLTKGLSHNDLNRILKAAAMMEARAAVLRKAVAWVRQGNNGHE